MISKTINTIEGRLVVKIPTELSEVTLGMLMQMQEDKTDVEVISILSGIPLDTLYLVKSLNEFDIFTDRVLSICHKIKYESDNLPMPECIYMAGKKVNVIKNLSIEPVGAFMECRNIIADEINAHQKLNGEENWQETFHPSLEATCLILAHYLYCPATGLQYNDTQAEEFKSQVQKLSIVITVPIAKYFFLSYPNLWRPKVGFWQALKQNWKRKLVLARLKYSATSTR